MFEPQNAGIVGIIFFDEFLQGVAMVIAVDQANAIKSIDLFQSRFNFNLGLIPVKAVQVDFFHGAWHNVLTCLKKPRGD